MEDLPGLEALRAELKGEVLLPGDTPAFEGVCSDVWSVSPFREAPPARPALVVQPRGATGGGGAQAEATLFCYSVAQGHAQALRDCARWLPHVRHSYAAHRAHACHRHRRRGCCRRLRAHPEPAPGCEVRRPRRGEAGTGWLPCVCAEEGRAGGGAIVAAACLACQYHLLLLPPVEPQNATLRPSHPQTPQSPSMRLQVRPWWVAGGPLLHTFSQAPDLHMPAPPLPSAAGQPKLGGGRPAG